jgi:predicted ferric reductase/mono/diheme cytochrome c family protein
MMRKGAILGVLSLAAALALPACQRETPTVAVAVAGAVDTPTAVPAAPTDTSLPATDVSESATVEPPRLSLEGPMFPSEIPSAVRGQKVFEANCATCHGAAGDGSGLPGAADFTDVEFMRRKKPAEFFEAIRDGVEGTAMPAWGDTLSEMDIWDVLYYETTFATSLEEIDRGKELFVTVCTTCHSAAGDGSRLEGAANFTDQAFMSNKDPLELFESIRGGVGGTAMPPWGDRFGEDDIWALVHFVRTFAYEYGEIGEVPMSVIQPPAEPDPVVGKLLWAAKPCVGCHGMQAEGNVGPRLAGTDLSFDQLLSRVRTGSGPMPAFAKDQISDLELQHIYAWLRSLVPMTMMIAAASTFLYNVGRPLALVGFVLILLQYILSAKIKWIEKNIGLDRLFRIHRTCGLAALALLFVHAVALLSSGTIQSYNISGSPSKLIEVLVGVFTLSILCVVAGSASLHHELRLKYETWTTIHKASYIIFPLGFVHSFLLGSDLASGSLRTFWLVLLGLYGAVLTYKLVNWVRVRSHPFKVVKVLQETQDCWSLYFEGKDINYKPGQFMIVQLIRDGKVSEPHPFTICSSPTRDRLSITVKSVGDFTSTVGDTKISDQAYVDAPYGVFSFLNHDAQDLLFIAAGIGITPFMSMLRYIRDKQLERDIILIWGSKTEQDIPFRDELERMAAEMSSLKVVYVISRQPDWPGEKGRIDAERLKKYISHLEEPQCFVCGPPSMTAATVKTLRDLGVPKKRIHHELFSF